MQMCALQLFTYKCEPPANLVKPGCHVSYIISFGLHVADDASHLESECTTIHRDVAQPVELTGNDAALSCCAVIGVRWGYLMTKSLDSGTYLLSIHIVNGVT